MVPSYQTLSVLGARVSVGVRLRVCVNIRVRFSVQARFMSGHAWRGMRGVAFGPGLGPGLG